MQEQNKKLKREEKFEGWISGFNADDDDDVAFWCRQERLKFCVASKRQIMISQFKQE